MGSLPDLPGKRLALDLDGTQIMGQPYAAASWTDMTSFLADTYGVDGRTTLGLSIPKGQYGCWAILFPSPVSLRGLFAFLYAPNGQINNGGYATSTDTTTGIDGTWSAYTNQGVSISGTQTAADPLFRESIAPLALDAITGLRIRAYNNNASFNYVADLSTLHVYGNYAQSGDRLQFWNPGNDLPLDANFLNYQDVGKGTTPAIRSFTVKNLSATKTATNVQLTHKGMPGADFTGGVTGTGVQLSLDQTSWFDTVGLGNLGPGAQSGTVYVRNVLPSTLDINPHAARLSLSMDSMA